MTDHKIATRKSNLPKNVRKIIKRVKKKGYTVFVVADGDFTTVEQVLTWSVRKKNSGQYRLIELHSGVGVTQIVSKVGVKGGRYLLVKA